MTNITDINLYDLLNVKQDATTADIKKAYRKKALTCHPDKNPDNPNAAEEFLKLSKALEILIDGSARAAYDKVLTAKIAAKLRHEVLDSKRKKLKEELEERERQAAAAATKYKSFESKSAEEKLAEEIERLRKEGSKELEEEIRYVREHVKIELTKEAEINQVFGYKEDPTQYRLKLKWKSSKTDDTNGGYNQENLSTMFSKYGKVNALVVSGKKNGSALLEFEDVSSAIKAQQLELGLASNPLEVTWLNGPPPAINGSQSSLFAAAPRIPTSQPPPPKKGGLFPCMSPYTSSSKVTTSHVALNDDDYEASVLRRLKEVEKQKSNA